MDADGSGYCIFECGHMRISGNQSTESSINALENIM